MTDTFSRPVHHRLRATAKLHATLSSVIFSWRISAKRNGPGVIFIYLFSSVSHQRSTYKSRYFMRTATVRCFADENKKIYKYNICIRTYTYTSVYDNLECDTSFSETLTFSNSSPFSTHPHPLPPYLYSHTTTPPEWIYLLNNFMMTIRKAWILRAGVTIINVCLPRNRKCSAVRKLESPALAFINARVGFNESVYKFKSWQKKNGTIIIFLKKFLLECYVFDIHVYVWMYNIWLCNALYGGILIIFFKNIFSN